MKEFVRRFKVDDHVHVDIIQAEDHVEIKFKTRPTFCIFFLQEQGGCSSHIIISTSSSIFKVFLKKEREISTKNLP